MIRKLKRPRVPSVTPYVRPRGGPAADTQHAHTHTHKHTTTYMHTYKHIHIHMVTHTHSHKYTRIHVHTHTHTHTRIQIHTPCIPPYITSSHQNIHTYITTRDTTHKNTHYNKHQNTQHKTLSSLQLTVLPRETRAGNKHTQGRKGGCVAVRRESAIVGRLNTYKHLHVRL